MNGWPVICSSPIVDKDDNVFFCADDGKCYGFDKNGNKLWELLVEEGTWLRTSPVIANDKVMYVAGAKTLYALVEVTPRSYLPLVNKE
jgi:outer membrane protein assembly factor BamB